MSGFEITIERKSGEGLSVVIERTSPGAGPSSLPKGSSPSTPT